MNVAVVEAWEDGFSRCIYYLCCRTVGRLDLLVRSDGENPSSRDCQRFRFGKLRIQGKNFRITDNYFRRFFI
jgi:hypothetical protein